MPKIYDWHRRSCDANHLRSGLYLIFALRGNRAPLTKGERMLDKECGFSLKHSPTQKPAAGQVGHSRKQ